MHTLAWYALMGRCQLSIDSRYAMQLVPRLTVARIDMIAFIAIMLYLLSYTGKCPFVQCTKLDESKCIGAYLS